MGSPRSRININALAVDLASSYISELKTSLKQKDKSISQANLFKAGNTWVDWQYLLDNQYFSDGAKSERLSSDLESTKLKRLEDAMDLYFGNSSLSYKDKFFLVCVDFNAGSNTSASEITIGLKKLQAAPEVQQQANLILAEIQYLVMKRLSEAKPSQHQGILNELTGQADLYAKQAVDNVRFIASLLASKINLEEYKNHIIKKESKIISEDKQFKGKLTEQEIKLKAQENLGVKYAIPNNAITAIANYIKSRDFKDLTLAVKGIVETEKNRAKTGIFKHPLSVRTSQLNEVISKDSPPNSLPPSPTASTIIEESQSARESKREPSTSSSKSRSHK